MKVIVDPSKSANKYSTDEVLMAAIDVEQKEKRQVEKRDSKNVAEKYKDAEEKWFTFSPSDDQ